MHLVAEDRGSSLRCPSCNLHAPDVSDTSLLSILIHPCLVPACPNVMPAHCHAGTETANKLGKFLVQAQFQGSVHSSAMFLTAAAQNLLCLKLASEMGVAISNPWVTWLKGALGPALVGLLITPLIIFKVCSWPLIPALGDSSSPQNRISRFGAIHVKRSYLAHSIICISSTAPVMQHIQYTTVVLCTCF